MKIIDSEKQFYDFVVQDPEPRVTWVRKEEPLESFERYDSKTNSYSKGLTPEQTKVVAYFKTHGINHYGVGYNYKKKTATLVIGDLIYHLAVTLTPTSKELYPDYLLEYGLLDDKLKEETPYFSKKKLGEILDNNDFKANIKRYQLAFNVPVVLFMPHKSRWHKVLNEERWWITHNPNLNTFHHLIGDQAMLIYQEIETWLSRQNPEPVTTIGSDLVIAQSKGFDEKSFRKAPTKKK